MTDARGGNYCSGCRRAQYAASSDMRAAQRDRDLRRRYRLGTDAYAKLLAAQGGKCAICRAPHPASGRAFAVDHDHACCPGDVTCGACIRGLLCRDCNLGIGWFRDRPESLRAAADYLGSAVSRPAPTG